ncbi:MAG: sugar kinase [Rhodobacteraceae bacterium]|nr:sugar kinase [Paracoccaceae bacterium]
MTRLEALSDGRPVFRQSVGGDTLNAMIAAARQGGHAGYMTAVGGDPFGEEILSFCAAEGVDTRFISSREQDPTGVNFIHPHPSGSRFSYARRGSAASHYSSDELPHEAIKAARVLHVSAISQAISGSMREAVNSAATFAQTAGTLVSYDLNLRLNLWTLDEARAAIEGLLPKVDIVLPSIDEAEILLGTSDEGIILDHFSRFDPFLVLLKRGERGLLVRTGGRVFDVPAMQVRAIDSTGAGDSLAGAFLAYFVETGDVELSAQRAVRVAAGTVTGLGATDPIPFRKDVL